MGHYDSLRNSDGPDRYKIKQRRRAHETKMNAQARKQISDDQIREFLLDLNECREADGLTCGKSTYCSVERHAQNVLFDEEAFDAAQTLVDHGTAEDKHEALGTNRATKQLVAICQDSHLITMGLNGHRLTDDGHQVMLGDDFNRPELSWDEQKANKWNGDK